MICESLDKTMESVKLYLLSLEEVFRYIWNPIPVTSIEDALMVSENVRVRFPLSMSSE